MDESYASSTVAFEIDSSSEQLSAKEPKDISKEDERVEPLLEFHRWDISARVIGVYQGHYNSESASLIVFEFRFNVDGGNQSRLSYAKITTAFEPARAAGQKRLREKDLKLIKHPDVKLYSPDKIKGPVTKIERTEVKGIDIALIKPSASLPIMPHLGYTNTITEKYSVESMTEIIGEAHPSFERFNQVIWKLKEDRKDSEGIPKVLRAAVVLENGKQPFHATVEVNARTGMGLPLVALPWSDPTPLSFKIDAQFGPSTGTSNFDQLTEADLTELCKFSGKTSSCVWIGVPD